jgi:6-phospho-beta-glucosidase
VARKAALIGGGGVRTPLLIHGLAAERQRTGVSELCLFDIDAERTEIIASIGREIVRRLASDLRISVCSELEAAVADASFVLSSIRVGGIAARARDERIAIGHGLAGQETTGPGGAAMALRTIPVTLAHARATERVAPDAWFINFTNPAGLITQALKGHTELRVVGICDTPSELFHRIAGSVGEELPQMEFDYAGLNHLGWVRRVFLREVEITERLLSDEETLNRLYTAKLFDSALIRTLGLIPTEYLFFYYRQRIAYRNQLAAGASRGEEIEKMNADLFREFQRQRPDERLEAYRRYLQRRNASYMRLEANATSALGIAEDGDDPFEAVTGYHRIALEVISSLMSDEPRTVVVNVPNRGAISDLAESDVVEVPCAISRRGIVPHQTGSLPESVRGLVLSVKAYERDLIRAAVERSANLAKLAMLEYPVIGQWDLACELIGDLIRSDREHLGYLV